MKGGKGMTWGSNVLNYELRCVIIQFGNETTTAPLAKIEDVDKANE